jgi:hypothetical protein
VPRIEITPPVRNETPVAYKVSVAAAGGGPVITSTEGRVSIGSAPESIAPVPQLEGRPAIGEVRNIPLPATFDDVVAGEEGRVLIFHLKDIKKLAILDVAELKIRGYVNLAEEPALFAAGARYLLVAYPSQNVIQRYSLKSLEKEKTVNNPFESLSTLVMGYSSPRGALFALSGRSINRAAFKAFDAETMAEVPANDNENTLNRISTSGENYIIRASGDGRTFGVFRAGISPSGFSIISYRNSQLTGFYEHESPGILVPNADGSLIMSSGAGVLTPRYVSVIARDGNSFIPSYHPMYFLGVPNVSSSSSDKATKNVSIFVGRSSTPLVYLPEVLAEMQEKSPRLYTRGDPMTMDKRYHFYPQWNLLLTLPSTNDKVVARPVDVRKILNDKDIDYLYVTSTPPFAKILQPVRFKLEAESKNGNVKFTLQSGPIGLRVSENGNVEWVAPAAPTQETVIVGLKDAKGIEALHTFQIVVTN